MKRDVQMRRGREKSHTAKRSASFFEFHREVEAVRNHGADTGESSGPVGRHRVLRGGCWNNNDRANLLSSNRNHNQPGNRNNNNGFRCVLVVSGGKALEPAVRSVRPRNQSAWIRMGRKLSADSAKKEPNPDGCPLGKTQRAGG
jgi:hypothetical protein